VHVVDRISGSSRTLERKAFEDEDDLVAGCAALLPSAKKSSVRKVPSYSRRESRVRRPAA
jgi:hypothetical protein